MSTKIYSVNSMDAETPAAWMSIVSRVTPAAQDSGRCRYSVEVAADQVRVLEAALVDDETVIEYERMG